MYMHLSLAYLGFHTAIALTRRITFTHWLHKPISPDGWLPFLHIANQN